MDNRLQGLVSQYSWIFEKSPAYQADPLKRNVYTELNQELNTYLSKRPQDTEILIKVVGELSDKTANSFNIKEALAMSALSYGLSHGAVEKEITDYNQLAAEAKKEQKLGIVASSESYAMIDSSGRILEQSSSIDASHRLKNTPRPEVSITQHVLQNAEKNMPSPQQLQELNKAWAGRTAIEVLGREPQNSWINSTKSPEHVTPAPQPFTSPPPALQTTVDPADAIERGINDKINAINADEARRREAAWRRELGLDQQPEYHR
jgi:hypothetical protein